jgi:hypothetical protein
MTFARDMMTVDRDMVSSNKKGSKKDLVALSFPLDHSATTYARWSFASSLNNQGKLIVRNLNTRCVSCSLMGISKCKPILLPFCQARRMSRKKGCLPCYDGIIPAVFS